MTTEDIAVAIRDGLDLLDGVETADGTADAAIDVHLDGSNVHITADTGEVFRVIVLRVG
jgi:hypothetical protein